MSTQQELISSNALYANNTIALNIFIDGYVRPIKPELLLGLIALVVLLLIYTFPQVHFILWFLIWMYACFQPDRNTGNIRRIYRTRMQAERLHEYVMSTYTGLSDVR